MKIRTIYCVFYSILISNILFGQTITKIEPPHWFVGMQNPNLQLMVYGSNVSSLTPVLKHTKVQLKKIHTVDNQNYLFIDLDLSKVDRAETFTIEWYDNQTIKTSTLYTLKNKNDRPEDYTFDSKDVIYLITPDRFANGETFNDTSILLSERTVDRDNDYARHGGDIQGIIDHLDYIKEMGFTSIWLNPIFENDQPKWSYHGYAITDYYKVDPRFGDNALYQKLSKEAEKRGLGIIMDMVANHCGNHHWWINDLPCKDWIHYQDQNFEITNHRRTTLIDPYASNADRELMVKGWFVPTMPDLNQKNPFLSTYLIQNTIWWIEFANLYGIRQDTYPYPYKEFMKEWTCRIQEEYPNFNIVGEEWSLDPSLLAYWQKGNDNKDQYESCLRSVMDFPLNSILVDAFAEEENWNSGLIKLYENLSNDYSYPSPNDFLVFADNHDMSRVATQAEDNVPVIKMALAYMLTTRGIPQILYGTEILMSHPGTDSHGAIRSDFPGGWDGDQVDAFNGIGLTPTQTNFQQWLKKLLTWRKTKNVIHEGQLMHFAPLNGIYVVFRYNNDECIMIIFNKNEEDIELPLSRFEERLQDYRFFKNVFTEKDGQLQNEINIAKKSVQIFELIK